MAGNRLRLEILTPDKRVVDSEVDYVSAPGAEGDFGVLPGHTVFVSLLRSGEVAYEIGGKSTYLAVSWGYAHVNETSVSILVENAELAEDIDNERATADLEKWKEELAAAAPEDKNYEVFKRRIERAQARIDVASRLAGKK